MLRGLIDIVYPPRCVACPAETEAPDGLCASCWSEVDFLAGALCPVCASPVVEDGLSCTSCLRHPPAWDRGAAAVLYDGAGRRMALALKHGDRTDLARPASRWIARAAASLLDEADIVAPVPLHWSRLIRRGFNQSAEIARALCRPNPERCVPDLLLRRRATPSLKGLDREARHAALSGAIAVNPRHLFAVRGKRVLLIDDVLTSGATLSASADALRSAGADGIDIAVLARAERRDTA